MEGLSVRIECCLSVCDSQRCGFEPSRKPVVTTYRDRRNSERWSVAKRLNNAIGHRLCLSILLSLYNYCHNVALWQNLWFFFISISLICFHLIISKSSNQQYFNTIILIFLYSSVKLWYNSMWYRDSRTLLLLDIKYYFFVTRVADPF